MLPESENLFIDTVPAVFCVSCAPHLRVRRTLPVFLPHPQATVSAASWVLSSRLYSKRLILTSYFQSVKLPTETFISTVIIFTFRRFIYFF